MTRTVWACDWCGWEWPSASPPAEDAECGECGHEIERVPSFLVETFDLISDLVARPLPQTLPQNSNYPPGP